MDYRIRGVDQAVVIIGREAKALAGKITAKNPDAGLQVFVKKLEIQMQLQATPKPVLGLMRITRPHQQVQRCAVFTQQIRGDMCADISG